MRFNAILHILCWISSILSFKWTPRIFRPNYSLFDSRAAVGDIKFKNKPSFRKKQNVLDIFRKAQHHIRLGENLEANNLLRKCLEINPNDAHSWLCLARLESNLGHVENARSLFNSSLQFCVNNVYILHAWGHMEQKHGNLVEARKLWSQALEIEPFNAYVCHALSQLEKNARNFDNAIMILERVMKIKPTTELCISAAEIYGVVGKPDIARSILQKTLADQQHDRSKILLSLAQLEEIHFGNVEAAKAHINEAMACDKNNVKIYIAKASVEMRQTNFQEARETLSSASTLRDISDGKHYTLWSTLELECGNIIEAKRILREGSLKFPGDPFLLQRWGTVEAKYGNKALARQLYAKSAHIRPHAPTFVAWAILEESEILQSAGTEFSMSEERLLDFEASDKTLNYFYGVESDVLMRHPPSNLTSKGFYRQQLSYARFLFNLGLRADPRHGPLYHAYGNMEMRAGNITGARSIFTKGIDMECSDILSIYHALGMLELNCNNISAARLNFHQGIKLSMQSALSLREHALPFLLHSLGTLELNSNRIDEAKRVFVRALSLFPNQPQLLLGLASSEMKLGRYEEARSFFQDSVKADPLHAQAWQSWALAEKSLSNTETARTLFRKGIEKCPNHGALYQAFALMEVGEGNIDEAQVLFQKAIENCPNHAQSYQAWSYLELKLGNFLKSKSIVSTGLKRVPNHAALWTIAGLVEEKLGNVVRSRHILSTAIALFPNHGALYKVLGELLARHGEISNAELVFKQGIQRDPSYLPLYHACALFQGALGNIEALSNLHKQARSNYQQSQDASMSIESIL